MKILSNSYHPNNSISIFQNLRLSYKITLMIFICLFLLSVIITIKESLLIYFLLFLIGISFVPIFIYNPKVWMYITTLSFIYFIFASEEDVSVADVLIGTYYIGGIVLWIGWQILIKKNRIIRTKEDWVLLLFITLLPLNFLIAFFNDIEAKEWIRVAGLFLLLLYYFPLREYFKNIKELRVLLFVLLVVVLSANIYQFYRYYQMMTTPMEYVFEIGKASRDLQQIFTCTPIFFIMFAVYQKRFINKLLLFIFASLSIIALIISFSRAFWLTLIINIILVFFLIPWSKKKSIVIFLLILGGIFAGLGFSLLKENIKIYLTFVERRFISTAKGTEDISVKMRLKEYDIILRNFDEYVIGGNGLGKSHKIYGSIYDFSNVTTNIHNGYLGMVYRVGLPMTILFFLIIILFWFKAIKLLFHTRDLLIKALLIGSAGAINMFLITSFITTPFLLRDGIILMAYIFSFIGISAEQPEYLINKVEIKKLKNINKLS